MRRAVWTMGAVAVRGGTAWADQDAPGDEVVDEDAPVDEVVEESGPPPSLEDTWAVLTDEALVAEGISRREVGDFEGSARRLAFVGTRGVHPEAAFHEGVSLEYLERFEEALDRYERVLAHDPDDALQVEAAFRRALVLEDLGRHAESVDQVAELQKRGGWTPLQELTLELSRGVGELQGNKRRKGIKRLSRALSELEGTGESPYMQARARAALTRVLLDDAADLSMDGGRKAARNLLARTSLMVSAEQQVVAIALLGEPEYVLQTLILLGDAYLALHDDMMAATPPRKFDEEQALLYKELIAERAAVLPVKARRYYDEGVQVAVRTQWQGSLAEQIRARRDALPAGG